MSPNMKLSILALVGAAAAIPQYGHGHNHKHFTPSAGGSGPAYPTGGWGNGYNSTAPSAVPEGTGKPSKPVESKPAGKPSYSQPAGEDTTSVESDYTITSTTTRTVYMTVDTDTAVPTLVGAQDVTTEGAACGQTVTVTATNRVTVTVPAPGASSSSAAAPQASSSVQGYEAPAPAAPSSSASASPSFVLASSSQAPEQSTSAPAAVSSPAAVQEAVSSYNPAPISSILSSIAAPASSAPAASPSASSAPSTGYSGGKRGLAYRWDGAADVKSFENGKFGFVWNWEADTKGDVGSLAANFIPTLRTLENAGEWKQKADAAIAAGSKVVFGLNEPDIASQANLGVSALCDAWKQYMNQYSGKATVVGPSVSSSENAGQGLDYLGQFVQQCPEAKFDDINIHWYGPASAGFDAFKAHYEKAASQFPGKKIWVTEFGLTGASGADAATFLKSAQEYLDGSDSCAGYSYYAVGNFDPSANLLGTMSALSDTGKVYVG